MFRYEWKKEEVGLGWVGLGWVDGECLDDGMTS